MLLHTTVDLQSVLVKLLVVLVLAYCIEGADGEPRPAERLIPFVSAYVDTVDLPGRRITVDWQADY